MEQDKDLNVHRTRSVQAVVSAGYKLYATNFLRLLRGSWLQALLYALTFGLAMAYLFTTLLPAFLSVPSASESVTKPLLVWLLLMVVWLLALALFVSAAGFAPFIEHEKTGAISRPLHWWGRWPLALAAHVLVVALWLMLPGVLLLFILPVLITAFDSIMSRRFSLAPPLKGFRRASHHTGAILLVALVTWLVVAVASTLTELPAAILSMANVESLLGAAHGDATDMPQPLFWFNFATFAVTGLLQAYVHLSVLFPFYYLWGTVTQEKK